MYQGEHGKRRVRREHFFSFCYQLCLDSLSTEQHEKKKNYHFKIHKVTIKLMSFYSDKGQFRYNVHVESHMLQSMYTFLGKHSQHFF